MAHDRVLVALQGYTAEGLISVGPNMEKSE